MILMYVELFWLILVFGICVLFSYANLINANALDSLIKPIPLKVWIPSMVFTVAAFVYMSIQWIWHVPADATVLGMYAIFFAGAVSWAPMTVDALHREEKTIFVLLALWIAASGSIGLLVLACGHPERPWLIVSAAWFMAHHVFLDAICWYVRWHIHGSTASMFTLVEDLDQKHHYDGLEYI